MSQNQRDDRSVRAFDSNGGDPVDGDLPDRTEALASSTAAPDMMPYVVPLFAYIALGGIENYLPKTDGLADPNWYLIAYSAKLALVGFVAWWFRATWTDLHPTPGAGALVLAAFLGVVVWLIWIGLDGLYPLLPFQGQRVGFDPNRMARLPRTIFIGVRMVGLVLLVPLIEELFWRSFLMRWLIDSDIGKVAIGRVTPVAAVVTSAMFALVHPEWLPALLTGLIWAWLLWWTRSLTACLVSHAVANLALGAYIIASGDWKYW